MIDDSFLTGSKMVMFGNVVISGGFSRFFNERIEIKKLENGIEIVEISKNRPIIHSVPSNPITNYHNVHRYGRFG